MPGATVTDDRPTVTADLDTAHGRIVGALSLLAAVSRDDPDCPYTRLDRVHGAVDTLVGALVIRARDDLAAAVLSGQSYEARISGSPVVPVDRDDPNAGTVSLTAADRAADRLHPRTRQVRHPDGRTETVHRLEGHAIDSPTYATVARRLARLADTLDQVTPYATTADDAIGAMQKAGEQLGDLYKDVTPRGDQCRSVAHDAAGRRVQCERIATRRAHCSKCWPHVHRGLPPDAQLLRDWNSRLDRDCECSSTVCIAADAHMPGHCVKRIPAGEPKRTCDGCTKRKWRARRDDKADAGPLEPSVDPDQPTARTERASDGTIAITWRNRKG